MGILQERRNPQQAETQACHRRNSKLQRKKGSCEITRPCLLEKYVRRNYKNRLSNFQTVDGKEKRKEMKLTYISTAFNLQINLATKLCNRFFSCLCQGAAHSSFRQDAGDWRGNNAHTALRLAQNSLSLEKNTNPKTWLHFHPPRQHRFKDTLTFRSIITAVISGELSKRTPFTYVKLHLKTSCVFILFSSEFWRGCLIYVHYEQYIIVLFHHHNKEEDLHWAALIA